MTFGDWAGEPGNWVFAVLAIVMVAGALRVVTSPNVVHAVLFLVATLAGAAGIFLLLGAEFVAWTVVLVSIGAVVVPHDGAITVLSDVASHNLHLVDPFESVTEQDPGAGRVTAPMPGKVTKVHVRPGQEVGRGAPLMILEAMKMEHTISAPGDGLVAEVRYRAGDLVEEGVELLVFEASEA